MATWKKIAHENGKHVVQFEDNTIARLDDDEYAELQGGKAVKKLSEARTIANLQKENTGLKETISGLEVERNTAQAELKAKTEALDAIDDRVEKAEATVLELQAANAALENQLRNLQASPPAPVADPVLDLNRANRDQLVELAKEKGIEVAEDATKAQIKAAIEAGGQ